MRFARCARLMLGSGTDSYDPTCELERGHAGPCKSSQAPANRCEWCREFRGLRWIPGHGWYCARHERAYIA